PLPCVSRLLNGGGVVLPLFMLPLSMPALPDMPVVVAGGGGFSGGDCCAAELCANAALAMSDSPPAAMMLMILLFMSASICRGENHDPRPTLRASCPVRATPVPWRMSGGALGPQALDAGLPRRIAHSLRGLLS